MPRKAKPKVKVICSVCETEYERWDWQEKYRIKTGKKPVCSSRCSGKLGGRVSGNSRAKRKSKESSQKNENRTK